MPSFNLDSVRRCKVISVAAVGLSVLVWLMLSAGCFAQSGQSAAGDVNRDFAAGQLLLKSGKIPQAAHAFEQIVYRYPAFAEAYFSLGVSYTQLGKPSKAITALQSYVKLSSGSPDGHAVLGILLFNEGRIADARPELEWAVRLDASQGEAAKTLGRVYNLEGNPAKTIALLLPRTTAGPADEETRAVLARALLSSGDAAAASKLLDGILSGGSPASLQAYILAAMAARDSHDLPKALSICERAAQAYPNSEQPENLAASFPQEALIARTTQRLKEIKNRPNDVAELIAVGRIMIEADKRRRGLLLDLSNALLTHAVQLEPENAAAWYHYGRCLVAQVKPEEADAALNKALAVTHDEELRVLILAQLGFVESNLNHLDAADSAYRQSLAINRKLQHPIPSAAFLYYQFLVLRDREPEGVALREEILSWEPLFAPALLERAKTLISQEQPQKAVEAAELVTRNTEDPEVLRKAHYLLVKIYTMTGNQKAAQAHSDWIKAAQAHSDWIKSH